MKTTKQLQIPDIYFAGYLTGNPGSTIQDAVAHWLEQEDMERKFLAARAQEAA